MQGEIAISNSATSYWNLNRDDSTGALTISDTGTQRFAITTAGNVGIGGASGGAILQLNNSSASYLDIKSDNVLRTRIYNDSSQTILESTTSNLIFKSNSTERMRLSGGNVGIGGTPSTHRLEVKGYNNIAKFYSDATATELKIAAPTVNVIGLYTGTSDALTFGTADTERMRIRSDGTTGFFGAGANTRSDTTLTTGTSDNSKRWFLYN